VLASESPRKGIDHLMDAPGSSVDLYWLPLGAGDALPIVSWNGRLYEAIEARRLGRRPCQLFHAALKAVLHGARFVIEMAPAWSGGRIDHGAVVHGPVGMPWLGRSRFFRYDVRRWRDGVIPDVRYAIGGPQRLTADAPMVERLLAQVDYFPTATWGRDELHAGEMWNSNSLVSWLLVRAGIDVQSVHPPSGGRAPGWAAGVSVATR